MKLEIGMYVRTNIGIAKVHTIKDNKVLMIKTRNNRVGRYFTVLKEPSRNIIDLIEVDDYVNGSKVNIIENEYIYFDTGHSIHYKYIETIVTKEQFKAIQYKVV